jgi:hypothetical protein
MYLYTQVTVTVSGTPSTSTTIFDSSPAAGTSTALGATVVNGTTLYVPTTTAATSTSTSILYDPESEDDDEEDSDDNSSDWDSEYDSDWYDDSDDEEDEEYFTSIIMIDSSHSYTLLQPLEPTSSLDPVTTPTPEPKFPILPTNYTSIIFPMTSNSSTSSGVVTSDAATPVVAASYWGNATTPTPEGFTYTYTYTINGTGAVVTSTATGVFYPATSLDTSTTSRSVGVNGTRSV